MEHRIKARDLRIIVIEQEMEQLRDLGLVDVSARYGYRNMPIHYGAVGSPIEEDPYSL